MSYFYATLFWRKRVKGCDREKKGNVLDILRIFIWFLLLSDIWLLRLNARLLAYSETECMLSLCVY